jgi:FkbM family methyltransferase
MVRTQLKALINKALRPLGVSILSVRQLDELMESEAFKKEIESLPRAQLRRVAPFVDKMHAQLGQDLFVLAALDFRRDGFFVDLGAADGVNLSNTALLEQEFGWRGICAEPARCFHESLRASRTAEIETACVWKETGGVLDFNETSEATFSTIAIFSDSDMHGVMRQGGRRYQVGTISLLDLLQKYDAPAVIDYLSIDTEGSEYEILRAFDFGRYRFRVITCEHNYTPMRAKIFELLSARGYVRRYPRLSRWDDWYVLQD